MPDVVLSRTAGIPIYYTPYIAGLLAQAASAFAVYFLLKKWGVLDRPELLVLTGSYVLAGTYLVSTIYFAERDEFVIWGLVPFLIAQLAITRSVRLPSGLAWPVLALGAVCILIKPHYGLLPAIVLGHRIWLRRRLFPVFWDPDFLALAGSACLYALATVVLFPDFIKFVLPDFLKLYIPVRRPWLLADALPKVVPLLFLLAAPWIFSLPAAIRRAVQLYGWAAAVSAGLFILQGKGVPDHLIPATVFFFCGLGIFLYGWGFSASRNQSFAVFTTLAILSFFAWSVLPINHRILTHDDYRNLELTQLAAKTGPNETFCVFSEGMEMIHQASIYGGAVHASRFPDLWWLHGLLLGWEPKDRIAVYADYTAEDLRRYKPAIIADQINIQLGDGRGSFDTVTYLSQYPAFRAEMKHYRKDGQLADNRRYYFRGTTLDTDYPIVYDIYRRLPDKK